MYLNQYKQNKNDSININDDDNCKNKKYDDGNTVVIKIIMIIILTIIRTRIMIMIIINRLFQSGDFSAGSTVDLVIRLLVVQGWDS